MDPLGIEFHENNIQFGTHLAVLSIQLEAVRLASHPGVALSIHL